ncbi:hypothetical protein, partial [Arsenicicoccus bolidensis]
VEPGPSPAHDVAVVCLGYVGLPTALADGGAAARSAGGSSLTSIKLMRAPLLVVCTTAADPRGGVLGE